MKVTKEDVKEAIKQNELEAGNWIQSGKRTYDENCKTCAVGAIFANLKFSGVQTLAIIITDQIVNSLKNEGLDYGYDLSCYEDSNKIVDRIAIDLGFIDGDGAFSTEDCTLEQLESVCAELVKEAPLHSLSCFFEGLNHFVEQERYALSKETIKNYTIGFVESYYPEELEI